jgi:hypothetical protein
VLIKILYLVLVLSTVALLGTAAALYFRLRRHMAAGKSPDETQGTAIPGTKV